MKPVTKPDFSALISSAGIREPGLEEWRPWELWFDPPPARTIFVHLAPDEPLAYVRDVTNIVLQAEEQWLLAARHASPTALGLLSDAPAWAVLFESSERASLADYLCTRSMAIGEPSCDLYVLSGSASTLVTWDHHTADDGLSIQTRAAGVATELLVSLNQLGAELELFYRNGRRRYPTKRLC